MQNKRLLRNQVFAGIGLGLLIGIIAGLSVSPVVKTILGTLAALLGAFLGLQGSLFKKGETSTDDLLAMSLRTGSFGVACALAIVGGVLLRTHNVLGISIKAQVDQWIEAGYTENEAKKYVVYDRLKLLPDETGNLEKVDSNTMSSASGFLFSKEEMQNYCISLSLEKYNGDTKNTLDGFQLMNPTIQAYANILSNYNDKPTAQKLIMQSVNDLICHLAKPDVNYENFCKEFDQLIIPSDASTSLDNMRNSEMIELSIMANEILSWTNQSDQSELLAIIQKIICST
ncbi:hypothetical protein [Ekhidna sp.]|uniref:hypothetical protein n=1 Tax=Ekhidna sp. TaxID=2608089 RepID=UPI003BAB831F